MAVPFSNTKLRVPKGFQNILEGLAREVLRSQPDNIFEFGSKYFEQLLRVRDETGHDPAVHGARMEDRFYNNDAFSSPSVDAGDPQQQDAAVKIQTEYRRHAAEQEVAGMREDAAATTIQAGVRGHQEREETKEQSSEDRLKDEEEVDIDLDDPEVAAAAVKIQAGFKGYKARKEVKDSKEADKTEEKPSVDIDLNDPEVTKAATTIQAGFRGHKTRQEMKQTKENQEKPQEAEKAEEPEKKDVDIDFDDPETAQAALKIQAGFRGYKTRKEIKESSQTPEESKTEETTEEPKAETTEEPQSETKQSVDIDLNDPDIEKAATKIQAGFKGYKVRQDMKDKMKETKEGETTEEPSQETKEAETKEEASQEAKEEGETKTEEAPTEAPKSEEAKPEEGAPEAKD